MIDLWIELDYFLLHESYFCRYKYLNKLFTDSGTKLVLEEFYKGRQKYSEDDQSLYVQVSKTLNTYRQLLKETLEFVSELQISNTTQSKKSGADDKHKSTTSIDTKTIEQPSLMNSKVQPQERKSVTDSEVQTAPLNLTTHNKTEAEVQTITPEENREVSIHKQFTESPLHKSPVTMRTEVIDLGEDRHELNQHTEQFKPYVSCDIDKMIRNAEWKDIKPNQIMEVI